MGRRHAVGGLVGLALFLAHACAPAPLVVAEGRVADHQWRYELVEERPQWVVDGQVTSRTVREPQFSPAHPHLIVGNFVPDLRHPFVQLDVRASADVDRAVLVSGGHIEDDIDLVPAIGREDRQHGAASADPKTWSAVIACRDGVQIDLNYGWLPSGFPQWTPPADVCV